MGTPKKPIKKSVVSKITGATRSDDELDDLKPKKKIVDDDDDEFDMPLDDLGYETFDGYDEEDDY